VAWGFGSEIAVIAGIAVIGRSGHGAIGSSDHQAILICECLQGNSGLTATLLSEEKPFRISRYFGLNDPLRGFAYEEFS